ncbi:MAG: SRPBCC domain-containing protein [Planctomycetes bacterium]|nr:SRPBCC domain-containing protein [Planctomycetota bacterium]
MLQLAALRVVVAFTLMAFAPRGERTLVWEHDVGAPVAAVWRAYTTAEGLRGWCAPKAEIELAIGGSLRLNVDADAAVGDSNDVVSTILAFEPERLLATQSKATAPVWSIVYFAESAPGKTHLRLVSAGWSDDAKTDAIEAAFRAEREHELVALEKYLHSAPSSHAPTAVRTTVCEKIVDATPAEVWKLYTTKAGAESWMVARASIELAVGGVIKTSYDPQSNLADGTTITTHILAYEPERLLATRFDVSEAAKFLKLAESTWVVQTFEPVGADKTRVRCAHLGFGEGADWDPVYAFFAKGNAYELGKLAEHCAELQKSR